MRPGSRVKAKLWTMENGTVRQRSDQLATEEPMEIRLLAGGERQTVAVTMRTPGADFELAAGFLYTEGIVEGREDIARIAYCVDVDEDQQYNVINVTLRGESLPDLQTLERHFFTSSACGICGKASLDQLALRGCRVLPPGPVVSADVLHSLPDSLHRAQPLFEQTGGLHGVALFTSSGELLAAREDVGRHNAVDKLIGWAFTQRLLPLHESIMLVSGRSSYEIMQKCLMAGIPIVCAVSAPSSLAVQVAQNFNMTLIGFLRGERFNIYSSRERILRSFVDQNAESDSNLLR